MMTKADKVLNVVTINKEVYGRINQDDSIKTDMVVSFQDINICNRKFQKYSQCKTDKKHKNVRKLIIPALLLGLYSDSLIQRFYLAIFSNTISPDNTINIYDIVLFLVKFHNRSHIDIVQIERFAEINVYGSVNYWK